MESAYVARGAMLFCEKGTHPRRLNIPKDHGVYALGKPLIQNSDCVKEENVTYFGICTSGSPPEGAEEILLAGYVPEGEDASGVQDVQGLKCSPDIIGTWRSSNKKAHITGEFPAVTVDSYLVCSCGGLIKIGTSGQEFEG